VPRRVAAKAALPKKKRRGRPPVRESGGSPVAAAAAAADARIIKKYGNRRFYDLTASRPVTLEEIADMVRAGHDVRVLDMDTDADITKRILTRIILEQRNRDKLELLPAELLRKIISLRDDALTTWLEQYLQTGARWLQRQVDAAGAASKIVDGLVEGNLPYLKNGPGADKPPTAPAEKKPAGEKKTGDKSSAEDLRTQVDELQRRLDELTNKVGRR
jgi:polyhydroxyalkanoate synthesis repressor PhaR